MRLVRFTKAAGPKFFELLLRPHEVLVTEVAHLETIEDVSIAVGRPRLGAVGGPRPVREASTTLL